ncbi:MAG: type II toxin-antitoxin system VapC family toxin [Pseudomonadota bacterium]
MGALVLDASAVAGAVFKDEDPAFAAAALRMAAKQGAQVPSLFWYEVRNLLLIGERRGRLLAASPEDTMTMLRLGGLGQAHDLDDAAILAVGRTHDLSGYDAAYAALAIRENAPLATLGKKLIAAGEAGAFTLWQPLDPSSADDSAPGDG